MKCRRSRNTYMMMVAIHRGIEKLCKNRVKYSIFKRRRKFDKGSYEGNITKQNDLKKTAKNILLCYFSCPYIFYSVEM